MKSMNVRLKYWT